ncbi:MAG TPA: magnesium transporter CorA family protein [Candidatus Methanomethylophilaceae archaeon]|nr:magnesium transporter CorA family protein [Candidatus Methanomethylophilaceae archaeon]
MYEIFAIERGRITKVDEIQDNVWINMVRPTPEEVEMVASVLNIDKAPIMAALDDEEESRVEIESDYSLILIDAPATEIRNQKEQYATYPLSIIITSKAILTVSLVDIRSIRSIIDNKYKHSTSIDVEDRTYFALTIMYRISMQYQNYLKVIAKKRMTIEASIRNKTQRNDLFELHELEANLVYFKTSLSVNISILERLSKQFKFITEPKDRDLIEDVMVETDQALKMTTTYSEIIRGTRQLVQADINNSLTGIMKFLTSITLVVSIPTMISGIFGMNFINIPLGEHPLGFIFTVSLMMAVMYVSIRYLRKRDLWR